MSEQMKSAKRTATKNSFINSFFALVFSLPLGMIFIGISGYSPLESYKAISGVSLGTAKGSALSLSQAIPIMFTGFSFALTYRVRMINTGAEGQLYAGAMAAALVGAYIISLPDVIHVPLVLLAAVVTGGAVAFFVAPAKIKFGAGEVIMTLMLNGIIQLFTSCLANGPLKPPGSGAGQTEHITDSAKPVKLIPRTQLTIAIFVVIIVAILLQLMLNWTVFGYEIQVMSLNLGAAKVAGISVPETYLTTLALSGAMAGLGGATVVLGVNYRSIEGFSPGYGFVGIPVAALAAYSPVGIILSASLIEILKVGTITLNRTMSIPAEFVDVIQVLVIIFMAAPALIQAILKQVHKFKKKKQESYGGES